MKEIMKQAGHLRVKTAICLFVQTTLTLVFFAAALAATDIFQKIFNS